MWQLGRFKCAISNYLNKLVWVKVSNPVTVLCDIIYDNSQLIKLNTSEYFVGYDSNLIDNPGISLLVSYKFIELQQIIVEDVKLVNYYKWLLMTEEEILNLDLNATNRKL